MKLWLQSELADSYAGDTKLYWEDWTREGSIHGCFSVYVFMRDCYCDPLLHTCSVGLQSTATVRELRAVHPFPANRQRERNRLVHKRECCKRVKSLLHNLTVFTHEVQDSVMFLFPCLCLPSLSEFLHFPQKLFHIPVGLNLLHVVNWSMRRWREREPHRVSTCREISESRPLTASAEVFNLWSVNKLIPLSSNNLAFTIMWCCT